MSQLTPDECKALSREETLKLKIAQVNPGLPHCKSLQDASFGDFIAEEDSTWGRILVFRDTHVPLQPLVRFVSAHPDIKEGLNPETKEELRREKVESALRNFTGQATGLDKAKFAVSLCYVVHFSHILEEELRTRYTGFREMVDTGQAAK